MSQPNGVSMAKRTRRRVQILAIGIGLALVLSVGVWWVFARDSRQDLPLDALTHFDGTGYSFVFDDLEPAPCDDLDGCVESMSGTHADLFKFDNEEAAKQFSESHAGARQSNWIVIVFTDTTLNDREQDGAFDLLDDTWSAQ